MTFIYVVMIMVVACCIGALVWGALKNAESDAIYEQDIRNIYRRKR